MYKTFLVLLIAFCVSESAASDEDQNEFRNHKSMKPSCNFRRSGQVQYPVVYNLMTGWYNSHIMETQVRNDTHPLHFKQLDKNKPTVLIIPGRYVHGYFYDLTEEFWGAFTLFGYNTIIVRWFIPHFFFNRTDIKKEVLHLGVEVGKAITDLYKQNIVLERIIAHRMGIMVGGKAVNSLSGFKVERFVALDPYQNYFQWPVSSQVTKHSVKLLEVFHTSIGQRGLANAIGHRDFYPNGGTYPQADCKRNPRLGPNCANNLAYLYYTNFRWATSTDYKAFLCSSWVEYKKGKCFKNPSLFMLNTVDLKDSPTGKYYIQTPPSDFSYYGDYT